MYYYYVQMLEKQEIDPNFLKQRGQTLMQPSCPTGLLNQIPANQLAFHI